MAAEVYNSSNVGVLVRSSVGQNYGFGELYDARTELFLSQKLFLSTLPDSFLEDKDNDNPYTQLEFKYSDQISDKMSHLKVEAELQLPILFGRVTLGGSGNYLHDTKKSARTASGSLLYNILTKTQRFSVTFKELAEFIDIEALQNPNCTHFVSSIQWGARTTAVVSVTGHSDSDKTTVDGCLRARLQKLGGFIRAEGSALGEYGDYNRDHNLEISLAVYSDTVDNTMIPNTVEDAIELMRRVPTQLANVNNGKGKPLVYTLSPISVFEKYLAVQLPLIRTIRTVDATFIDSTVYFLEQLSEVKSRLFDVVKDFERNKKYVDQASITTARDLQAELQQKETDFKQVFTQELVKVRAGVEEMKKLVRKVEHHKYSTLCLPKFEQHLDDFDDILRKIRFIEIFTSKGIDYLGQKDDLLTILSNCGNTEVLLLTLSECFKSDPIYLKTAHLFASLEQKKVVVDLDLIAQSLIHADYLDKPRVICYKGGRIVSYDVLKDVEDEASKNCARMKQTKGKVEHVAHLPVKRVPLSLSCPGFRLGCCPATKLEWVCPICSEVIDFGFDQYLYCTCGKGPAKDFEFRCSHERHGTDFISVADDYPISVELSKLRPFKNMNILLLGQSGVGKSTFINSFVNYQEYETLELAKQGGAICVVPSKFTLNGTVVQIGQPDVNESLDLGDSKTQSPKTHTTIIGDRTVRIIDTPGVGDTKGIAKDRENMKLVLDHISYLDELHGVIILLRAGCTLIDTLFRFCIVELLTHLHRSASFNIVFVFTHAQAAFYGPGDTQLILQKLLDDLDLRDLIPLCERTMFCVDNQSFRYLCAQKYPSVNIPQEEVEVYEKCWKVSVKEYQRLFNQIKSLPPHMVKETTTLCTARQRILNLTKPIAEITQTIQIYISSIADCQRGISKSTERRKELAKKLYEPSVKLEAEHLDHPRTVCTNTSCVTLVPLGKLTQIEYNTHCHIDCQLENVVPETFPNRDLLKCWAMNDSNKCRYCGCGWDQHMHITYTQKRVVKNLKVKSVEDDIADEEGAEERIKDHMSGLEAKRLQLLEEQGAILHTSLKFGRFLKKNAIAPYNDGFKNYLEYLIDQEEKKETPTDMDRDTLNGLNEMMRSYNEEVRILNETMNQNGPQIDLTVEDINKLEADLYKLPMMGQQIYDNVQASQSANRRAKAYCEQPLPRRTKNKSYNSSAGEPKKPGIIKKTTNFVKNQWNNLMGTNDNDECFHDAKEALA